jgi:hypothetical protein
MAIAATVDQTGGAHFDPALPIQYFSFDTAAYPLRQIIEDHLREATGCERLENFHTCIPADRMPTDPMEGTAHTYGHDLLYAVDPAFRQAGYVEARDRGFIATYRALMRHLQDEVFCEPVVFQRLPSLRIQYPGFTSYGVMHRDREYNHPKDEINIWMPITDVRGTATMVIESEIDKADYFPIELPYGEFVVFDSALMHGNVVNEEGYTRFSIDMRVIPQRIYNDAAGSFSATAGKEFIVGGYYDRFD